MFRAARATTIGLSLLGVIVFGALLAIVQSNPLRFEARAQTFVIHEIEKQVGVTLESLPLQSLTNRFSEQMQARKREIDAAVSQFIAAVVGAMCRLDCMQRAQLEAALEQIYQRQLAALNIGLDKLRSVVEGRYRETLTQLHRDVVVFLSVNLVVMGAALMVALGRGAAARHLLPIAAILTVSTIIAACWYVFGQNWLWTIIYADYVGWAYLGILAVLFIFLADIALNRARATSEALNIVAQLLRSGASWSPC
jgi:hypothetical protein